MNWKCTADVLTGIVAAVHVGIMLVEMIPKIHKPLLLKLGGKLGFSPKEDAVHASRIVMNAGLFNGFLAAGLIWGLMVGASTYEIQTFFLVCITIAGLFGAITLPSPMTLALQSVPACLALIAIYMARHGERLVP